MDLKTYLKDIKMSIVDFGELIQYNPQYIYRITNGHMIPGKKMAKEIEKITGGAVKRDDFQKKMAS
jgi:ribosome-binding protein aMBF1 (putative translation factor)